MFTFPQLPQRVWKWNPYFSMWTPLFCSINLPLDKQFNLLLDHNSKTDQYFQTLNTRTISRGGRFISSMPENATELLTPWCHECTHFFLWTSCHVNYKWLLLRSNCSFHTTLQQNVTKKNRTKHRVIWNITGNRQGDTGDWDEMYSKRWLEIHDFYGDQMCTYAFISLTKADMTDVQR